MKETRIMKINHISWTLCFIMAALGMKAQPALTGFTGLLQIPTANIHKDGTLLLGVGYTPAPYAILEPNKNGELSYYTNLTFLPFLEIVVGATLPDNANGRWGIGDRKGLVRIQVLKERANSWRPSVLIGFHDPFNSTSAIYGSGNGSNQNFNANYLVLSKTIKLKNHFDLSGHLGYGVPFRSVKNAQLSGLFGGMTVDYKNLVSVMVEYDTQKFNCGMKVLLFNRLYLTGALLEMKAFTGGVNFRINL